MTDRTSHLLLLNLAMLCVGTSGVLGRYIPLAPGPAIWWRSLLAVGLLSVYCRWRSLSLWPPNRRSALLALVAGGLLGVHWVLYFYALQLAGVAIGMLSIFTYPAMTALLEPPLLGRPYQPRHLPLAALVLGGVYFLVPPATAGSEPTTGLLLGLLSALLYALRNLLLKTQVEREHGSTLMARQLGAIVLLGALLLLLLSDPWPTPAAWPYLLLLAGLTTAVGHTLFLSTFRYFSVTTVSLLSCIQPIYGIAYAYLFFGEAPGWWAALGGACILAAVAVEARSETASSPNAKRPAR